MDSGEGVVSGSLLRPRDGKPNLQSRDDDDPLAFGGGWKDWPPPAGSGEGRLMIGSGALAAEILAAPDGPSKYMLVGLWLRGGE